MTLKLNEMGTTGLLEYIKNQPSTRRKALAIGRVCRVYKNRGIKITLEFKQRIRLASGFTAATR